MDKREPKNSCIDSFSSWMNAYTITKWELKRNAMSQILSFPVDRAVSWVLLLVMPTELKKKKPTELKQESRTSRLYNYDRTCRGMSSICNLTKLTNHTNTHTITATMKTRTSTTLVFLFDFQFLPPSWTNWFNSLILKNLLNCWKKLMRRKKPNNEMNQLQTDTSHNFTWFATNSRHTKLTVITRNQTLVTHSPLQRKKTK